MGWDYGEQVEITIGDGKGRVQVSGTPYVWCRTADRGRVLQVQWLRVEPVPPAGTHVIAHWQVGGLCCPPVGE